MDRRSLAQELLRWAVEEMGLPQQKAPSEEMLQRLFIGQCADIWKYIIRHVRSQRTVKNIEGNLLWYQQLQHCEALRLVEEEENHCRKHLCQEIKELRSELQHLQEQIKCAEEAIISHELNNHKSQDYRRRTLMLRAFHSRKIREWKALQQGNLLLQYRCDQLQDVTRASQSEIVFPELEPTSAMHDIPQPEVLRNVREDCQIRYTFLCALYNEAVSRSGKSDTAEFLRLSHQEWMSLSEKIWCSNPPCHVVSSLQHLTMESTQDLQDQQSLLALGLVKSPCLTEIRLPNNSADHDSVDGLPSFNSLVQDGWAESVKVMSQVHSVDSQSRDAHVRLTDKIKEVHKSLSDGSESSSLNRSAFDAELRLVLLRTRRDTLLQECQELRTEAEDMKQEINLLQQKQQEIQDACFLLSKKQNQIQILLRGTESSKTRIRHSCSEVQKFILEKINPLPQEIVQESQRQQDSITKDVRHFFNVYLPALYRVSTDGTHLVPAQELSINRLSNPNFPYYPIYKRIYASVGLSLCKAPETLLLHVAEMKKRLLFLNSLLRSRNRAMSTINRLIHESQDADTLLQYLSNHYKEQTVELVPKLRRLIEQCQKSQEYGKEVQATVTDWWEQPAQLCLPWEERGGQTLRQWRDRWMVAATALQRASGGKS